MLDTMIVSRFLKNDQTIAEHIRRIGPENLTISSITRAELRYGVAKRPSATRLAQIVDEFLIRISCQPWDNHTADTYGQLRATIESKGISLAPLDLMIAAHAMATNAILATADQAFKHVEFLHLEDWSHSLQ